jgi:hypothetical protein
LNFRLLIFGFDYADAKIKRFPLNPDFIHIFISIPAKTVKGLESKVKFNIPPQYHKFLGSLEQ